MKKLLSMLAYLVLTILTRPPITRFIVLGAIAILFGFISYGWPVGVFVTIVWLVGFLIAFWEDISP